MAAISLLKVSGVLSITQTEGYGKYYGATAIAEAKYTPNSDATAVNLTIGGDNYFINLTDLRVNSQAPTTMSTALVLLNSILGT